MLLLDTVTLIWLVGGNPRLGRRSRARIESAAPGQVGYSVVSLYEIGTLLAKRRIALDAPLRDWRRAVLRTGMSEEGLVADIAILATELDGLPSDPGDRLIAATARRLGATLITSDEKILAWPGELGRLDART